MALIRSITTAWSDAVTLSTEEVWQAREGAVFLTTDPTPALEDGIALSSGKALRFPAGTELRYRKAQPGEAMIVREAIGGRLTATNAALQPTLFLVAGQSNAIGQAPFDNGAAHPDGTLQWDKAQGERAATIPLDHPGAQAGTMGLDVAFATAYRTAHPTAKVIFIPVAVADAGFADGRWNPGDDLFAAAVAEANAAIAHYGVSGLTGILWQHGTRDATSGDDAEAYQGRLEAMVLALRAAITGSKDTPFLAGEIGSFLSATEYPGRDAVITAQGMFTSRITRSATVHTGDLSAFDGVHFDAASLRTLGARYVSALGVAVANVTVPVITGVPIISGDLSIGSTVEAIAAEVSPKPTVTSFQWLRDGTPIAGATDTSYTIQASDANGALTVRQVETGLGGTQAVASAAGAVGAAHLSVPAQVTELVVTPGDRQNSLSWGAPAHGGAPIVDYVVELDGGSGFTTLSVELGTATAFTHTGLSNGTPYAYRVSAVNAAGVGPASAPQGGTPIGTLSVPVNSSVPAISGTFETGETLAVSDGAWTGSPVPTITYQWTRAGVDIPGATGNTYALVQADEGSLIGCSVMASNGAGAVAVFLIAGQSNAVGWVPFDGGVDYPAGTYEWNQSDQLVAAATPLDHNNEPGGTMGWSLEFAIQWKAANPDRDLILVPRAQGATGFFDGHWKPGDPQYNTAVAAVNAALAANPGAVFEGILWHQGERDSADNISAAQYTTYMQDMVAGMRSQISGADATTPFICGEIKTLNAADDAINAAIRNVANTIGYAAWVEADTLATADAVHFNAASLRTMGGRYYGALGTVQPLPAPSLPVIAGVPTINGVEEEGETLTATAAPVTGFPAPTRTWQWERDGAAIAGATSNTHTLGAADAGATLTVVQTETNSAGTGSAESAATGTIAAAVSAPPTVLYDEPSAGTQANLTITVANRYAASALQGATDFVIEFHGTNLTGMWIGHAKGTAGDDRYNFKEAPTQVLFGGGGSVLGGSITDVTVSDPCAFQHNGVDDVIIAIQGTSIDYHRTAGPDTLNAFFKIGAGSEAASMGRSGYNEQGSGRSFGVLKISGTV